MLFITIIKVALRSLLSNKLRSFLTMLGIIIGVGAVIAMLAIGNGARDQITNRIKSMGSNLLLIRPGSSMGHGVAGGQRQSLKYDDLAALLSIDNVKSITPEVNKGCQLKYFNSNTNVEVNGVAPTYFEMRNFVVEQGRAFNDEELAGVQRVVILGPDTSDILFGNEYPIDKTIKIKGLSFTVIGVTKRKGGAGWQNPDETAIIPFTTMNKKIAGTDYFNNIDISVYEEKGMDKVKEGITKALRTTHKLRKDAADDFQIRDMAEMLAEMESTIFTFKLLLAGVAALSLLVGGIGIMNIMYVTVTERTREIGVRKALGAKNRDILNQFLLEAVVLTVIGGLMGIAFGFGSVLIYNGVSPDTYFKGTIDILSIIVSVSFSVAVGVFFGFYPAQKAAKMNPIDALRYE
ncbi:MAG: ABC transporter permease [Candidatus Wallbacteria bacterium]|nr:ABC transporter permease [Candidatus Wallbacteria bacterium]